ncbi:hypothetical protein MADA3029_260005 [Vibrio nigripulchritudo MADA3029]|uniref:Uncharacterized protein n=1 Tax=Vibrio nigripulchritudo SOn1 TaxID=1238450 RepID=A0AAV2VSM5_9VIBR|nr:hypothetical protein MADA3029_260005 [Vibrio nigripulchritudo MADA3029]CCN72142.1 hypothetical protein VIBNISFn118_500034 [Vibrio nigripulchritudo SFn118]CCN96253.1 hypothetical protein VIBNIENn2_730004 [Vibrio nigripulchritudo ENn2]CCO47405.1 hypothetical protein VIBNISOn1_30099 [Vibrio nigripulchritudo SOn1]
MRIILNILLTMKMRMTIVYLSAGRRKQFVPNKPILNSV